MKTFMHLLIGVIIFLTQSDVVMIVELPSQDVSKSEYGEVSARFADNRVEFASLDLSEIQALLKGSVPPPQSMPRISPISVPTPKRGPVK